MNLLTVLLGSGLAVWIVETVRSSMARDKMAKAVAKLFEIEIEIEEIKGFYENMAFSPSEPLGLYPPDITIYSEHGAYRLFEVFPRGRVAMAVTVFYRSVSDAHKPVRDAQEAIRDVGLSSWQGLASSSAHRGLTARFEKSRAKLLENAETALKELRSWRALLPVGLDSEDQ